MKRVIDDSEFFKKIIEIQDRFWKETRKEFKKKLKEKKNTLKKGKKQKGNQWKHKKINPRGLSAKTSDGNSPRKSGQK